MKAISLWQPHASLLAGGLKPFETRSWPAPKRLIGQRIAIHAAKATNDLLEIARYLADLKEYGGTGPCDDQMRAYNNAIARLSFKTFRELPRGAIIGTAILEVSLPTATLVDLLRGKPRPSGRGRIARLT